MSEKKPCGGCGGTVKSRVELLRKVSAALVEGHNGLAAMYRSIAGDLKDQPEEARAFLEAAEKQDRLAQESAMVTEPEEA